METKWMTNENKSLYVNYIIGFSFNETGLYRSGIILSG